MKDSRPRADYIARRRQCKNHTCKTRWTTLEISTSFKPDRIEAAIKSAAAEMKGSMTRTRSRLAHVEGEVAELRDVLVASAPRYAKTMDEPE